MTSKEKIKGNKFERDLVKQAISFGLTSERARGSDGRSLGFDKEVDLTIGNHKVQAKIRKKIASYLQIPDCCDVVIFRQDRHNPMVLMWYDEYLRLLKCSNTNK